MADVARVGSIRKSWVGRCGKSRGSRWCSSRRRRCRRRWARARRSRGLFPLRSSLSGIGPHLSLARARGREPEQAARGSSPSRGSWAASVVGWPLSGFRILFYFHFYLFCHRFWWCLEIVDLGFYLPKNYEINFVRLCMMCSILEKYKADMYYLVFGKIK
jgi:hypothetical protein